MRYVMKTGSFKYLNFVHCLRVNKSEGSQYHLSFQEGRFERDFEDISKANTWGGWVFMRVRSDELEVRWEELPLV